MKGIEASTTWQQVLMSSELMLIILSGPGASGILTLAL